MSVDKACIVRRGISYQKQNPTYIEVKHLFELLPIELQRRLVFRHARVSNKAIDAPLFSDDGVDGVLDLGFDGDVDLEEAERLRVGSLESEEVFVGGFVDVERVDRCRGVGETGFCDSEADATVCACDCGGGVGE